MIDNYWSLLRTVAQISFVLYSLATPFSLTKAQEGTEPYADIESAQSLTEEPLTITDLVIHGVPFSSALTDAPLSTTIVSDSRLREKGETSFDYEMESIPNLTWSSGTSRPRFCLIRGVGELEQYEGAPNPSVATIIDGIDFSGLGITVPLFDVE